MPSKGVLRSNASPLMQLEMAEHQLPRTGVCSHDPKRRTTFVVNKWVPFLRKLRLEAVGVQSRTLADFAMNERMPSQKMVLEFAEECLQLTEEWYGPGLGNISALYEFLVETGEAMGDSPYCNEQVPTMFSQDNYIMVMDGAVRKALYHGPSPGGNKADDMHMAQSVAESAIDNSVLPNMMSPNQAKCLLAGGKVKTLLLSSIATSQAEYLRQLSAETKSDLLALAPSDAKEEVERLAKDTAMMERLGIDTSTLSFKLLVENGFVVRSFGQLSTEQQDQINSFLKQELQSHSKKRQAVVAQAEKPTQEAANDDELADFLTFCRDHPGRLYKEDRKLHKQLLFLGMWSQELVVLKRSTVEQFTDSRYVPVRWHRQVPLWVAEKSAARDGAEIKERRSVGSEEWARFRKNKFPYGPSHGLSVSSGGLREGLDAHGSLAYELGPALSDDASAKLGNWYANDIEKILVEAQIINPASGRGDMLPGEDFHEIGQNPAIGSSIEATQHTQIMRGVSTDWPIISVEVQPMWVDKLGAFVDVCQLRCPSSRS
jgi:hypothetical protein